MLKKLKEEVTKANKDLVKFNLVTLTWGNVSGIDRDRGLVVIKASGVPYRKLTSAHMLVVDLEGKVVEGKLHPSTDLPTHLLLYKAWPEIGGITHTHSTYATMFAQACKPIRCFGTTHADYFHGDIPVTRSLTQKEVETDYELNTGKVIIERFAQLDPMQMPAVLVANHAPFVWGKDARSSVENSLALEETAKMALGTIQINPPIGPIPKYLLDKHFLRKHGPKAYYGQKGKG